MSKHWKEKQNNQIHKDYMSTGWVGGLEIESAQIAGDWVYFVEACGFTFQFASIDQIKEARDYFSKKVHPSGRVGMNPDVIEHHWQRWYERLPKGLNGGTKRERILKALEKALVEFLE